MPKRSALPARLHKLKTNFVSGAVSANMMMRSDTTAYENAAEQLDNFRLLPLGGITRAPGSLYRATVGETGYLAPFIFSETQSYVLAFVDEDVKIYSSAGALVATLSSTPWTAAQLSQVKWAQRGDTMFVFHPNVQTRVIKRTGASTFTIAAFDYDSNDGDTIRYQPYIKYAAPDLTITPAATSGTGVAITASAAVFDNDHIGGLIRYKGKEILVTGFTSATVVAGTVRTALAGTTASKDWDEAEYGTHRGWPAAGAFHEGRLWTAGGPSNSTGLNASNIGFFYKFDLGSGDDDESIQTSADGDQVSEIRHLVSDEQLLVFTDGGAFRVPSSDSTPITPGGIAIRPMPGNVGALHVRPRKLDGGVLVARTGNKAIDEFLYEGSQRGYVALEVSLLASHLVATPVDMDVLTGSSATSASYAFVVMTDGSVSVFHSNRAEGISAWTKWTTDGKYSRVAVINDKVFFLVERTISSSTAYYLEELDFDTTLDSSIAATSGSATGTWTGLSHLEAETVHGVSGESHLGSATVSSGSVTFDHTATSITIGLDYTPTLKTLRPEFSLRSGTMIGRMKRIVSAVIAVSDTVVFSVEGQQLIARDVTDDLNLEPDQRTGFQRFIFLGWDRDGQLTLTQTVPVALTVQGLQLEIAG